MDAATLTDRYVDTAMRTVPEKQRADLAAELQASIADQVDARVDAGEALDAAERAVLIDLGDPEKLAAGYTGRPLHLIGPRYYLDWWRLLKVLLWTVIPSVGGSVALGQVIAGAPVGAVIGSVWTSMLTAGLHVTFWATLVFVILERAGHETVTGGPWTPDRLPAPKESGATFGDMLATIITVGVLAGLIVWDLWRGFVPGHRVSLVNPGLRPAAVAVLFAVMALTAVLAVVVHAQGRWTMRSAVTNAVLVLVAVAALAADGGRLLNPAFFDAVISGDAAQVQRIVTIVTWFVIVGIAAWNVVDAFVKVRRARRGPVTPAAGAAA